jgi:hypothetical protein
LSEIGGQSSSSAESKTAPPPDDAPGVAAAVVASADGESTGAVDGEEEVDGWAVTVTVATGEASVLPEEHAVSVASAAAVTPVHRKRSNVVTTA